MRANLPLDTRRIGFPSKSETYCNTIANRCCGNSIYFRNIRFGMNNFVVRNKQVNIENVGETQFTHMEVEFVRKCESVFMQCVESLAAHGASCGTLIIINVKIDAQSSRVFDDRGAMRAAIGDMIMRTRQSVSESMSGLGNDHASREVFLALLRDLTDLHTGYFELFSQ